MQVSRLLAIVLEKFLTHSLNTIGEVIFKFEPQNLEKDLEAACGVIRELASRQSNFMKGPWSSDIWKTYLDHFVSSGLVVHMCKLRGILGMCNSLINKNWLSKTIIRFTF